MKSPGIVNSYILNLLTIDKILQLWFPEDYEGRRSVAKRGGGGGVNGGKRDAVVGSGSLLEVWGRCKPSMGPGAKHVFNKKLS